MVQNFKKVPSKVWLFIGLQWATTAVSFVLAWQRWPVMGEDRTPSFALGSVAFMLAVLVTFRWLHHGGWRRPLSGFELAIMAVAPVGIVAATNWWQSPYVFLLLNSVVVAAYSIGFATTMLLSLFASIVISVPYLFLGIGGTGMTDQVRVADSLRWSALIIFIGLTSGYAVRLSSKDSADERLSIAHREEVKKLQEANKLLFELHQVAQNLPVSLDTEDVVTSSFPQIENLIDFDSGAVLLKQEIVFTEGRQLLEWKIVTKRGHFARSEHFSERDLPSTLKQAVLNRGALHVKNAEKEFGLNPKTKVGLYTPIVLRDEVVGIIVLERTADQHFNDNDIEIVNNFCSALALALDNANWFSRLRVMGADEERNRIARELHDSIGQSLVFLGLSADSLIDAAGPDSPLLPSMQDFRLDVNEALGEMRNTLYDLRTTTTATHDLPSLLREYGERVRKRSGITIEVTEKHDHRLPVLQEKEMWRIAQEAIVNAEKYSGCDRITVSWIYQGSKAEVIVADNGVGFTVGENGSRDSYGLLGMQERAQSVGAKLEIVSAPGHGCKVTCTLIA